MVPPFEEKRDKDAVELGERARLAFPQKTIGDSGSVWNRLEHTLVFPKSLRGHRGALEEAATNLELDQGEIAAVDGEGAKEQKRASKELLTRHERLRHE